MNINNLHDLNNFQTDYLDRSDDLQQVIHRLRTFKKDPFQKEKGTIPSSYKPKHNLTITLSQT